MTGTAEVGKGEYKEWVINPLKSVDSQEFYFLFLFNLSFKCKEREFLFFLVDFACVYISCFVIAVYILVCYMV